MPIIRYYTFNNEDRMNVESVVCQELARQVHFVPEGKSPKCSKDHKLQAKTVKICIKFLLRYTYTHAVKLFTRVNIKCIFCGGNTSIDTRIQGMEVFQVAVH